MTVRYRPFLVLVIVGVMFALTPLAQASPPDPTWIGGFYDDADHDDAVLMVTSSVAMVEILPLSEADPLWVIVMSAPHHDESLLALLQPSSCSTRAPPAA